MRSHLFTLAAAAAAAAIGLTFAGAGGANAQTAAAARTATAQPGTVPLFRTAPHPLDSKAIAASIAAHHGVLTVAEAKRFGIQSDTIYKNTPQIRALANATHERAQQTAPAPNLVRPQSASGCNDLVCIEVTGSGLEVTKWFTAAYSPDDDDICSYPAFWVDGELDWVGEEICGTVIEAWDDDAEWFDNNTQLCNTWPGVAGRPCETVHD